MKRQSRSFVSGWYSWLASSWALRSISTCSNGHFGAYCNAGCQSATGSLTVACPRSSRDLLTWNGGVARQTYLLMIYDVLVTRIQKLSSNCWPCRKMGNVTDGKTYTFWIRKGCSSTKLWELTAEMFKYSIERMIGRTRLAARAKHAKYHR